MTPQTQEPGSMTPLAQEAMPQEFGTLSPMPQGSGFGSMTPVPMASKTQGSLIQESPTQESGSVTPTHMTKSQLK